LAGWRSHAEGHLTFADDTSHAEGRSTMAFGKASHAEGGEIYEDTGLVTTKLVSIYGDEEDKGQTTIYVDKNPADVLSENILDENNIISIGPEVKDAFDTTDSKRIFEFDNEIEYSIVNDLEGITL